MKRWFSVLYANDHTLLGCSASTQRGSSNVILGSWDLLYLMRIRKESLFAGHIDQVDVADRHSRSRESIS